MASRHPLILMPHAPVPLRPHIPLLKSQSPQIPHPCILQSQALGQVGQGGPGGSDGLSLEGTAPPGGHVADHCAEAQPGLCPLVRAYG